MLDGPASSNQGLAGLFKFPRFVESGNTCHVPASDFTDRSAVPLPGFKAPRFFAEDPQREYKVPSLLYVGGTPPYYHDGSAATLEDLVEHDQDRMGHTSHLTPDERTALVAYLRTL